MSSHETIGEQWVAIRGDGSKFPGDIESTVTGGLNDVVKKGAKILGGLVVAAKLKDQFKQGLAELEESLAVAAQVTAVIASTGGAAGVTAGHVADLADKMLNLAGADDEVIAQGAAILLGFTAVKNAGDGVNAIFDRATVAGLDLATRGFGSVTSNAKLLGLALSDPEVGLTKLRRAGILLTDQQIAAVEAFVKVGNLLGAQGVILDAIEGKVGGAAEQYGTTLPGKLMIAQQSLTNLKAELVSGAAPAMEFFAEKAKIGVDAIEGLPDPIKNVIGGIGALAFVAGGIVGPIGGLSTSLSYLLERRVAHAAAAALETGALTANTGATLANAGAQNSAASVSGLYTAKSGGLASALGKAGIVAAAAAATYGMYAYGQSLNKTKLDSEELTRITTMTGNGLLSVMDELAQKSVGPFSHMFDDAIKGLAEKGPEGIGVLRQMRDHYAAIGDSEHLGQVDAALKAAAESQAALTANAELGSDALADEADAANELLDAQAGLVALTDQLAQGFDKQYQAMLAPAQLHADYEAGIDDLVASLRENKVTLDDATGAFHDYNDAGRSNLDAMDSLGGSIVAMVEQRYRETHSLEDAKAAGALYVQNLRDQLEAAGYSTEQIDLMIQTMHLTPEDIDTVFSNNAVSQMIAVEKYKASLEELPPEKRIPIETALKAGDIAEADRLLNEFIDKDRPSVRIGVSIPDMGGTYDPTAYGRWGDVFTFAGGGFTPAHIARGGRIKYAEPETGGEAFIPRLGNRDRNLAILGVAAGWNNARVVAMASGGIAGGDVAEAAADYQLWQVDQATTAAKDATKSAAEAAKAAEDAAKAAEAAAREFAQAVQAQHGREDVQFKVGALSSEEYRALLNQRMAETEQFSSDWFSAWQAIAGIDQAATDAAKKASDEQAQAAQDLADAELKAADERQSIQDNMFRAGVTGTEQYLETLQDRLGGLVQYSDAYRTITEQIAGITDANQRAQEQAAEDQLDLLRNKVEFGAATASQLVSALTGAETGLVKYSNEWTTLQREIDRIKKENGLSSAPPLDPALQKLNMSSPAYSMSADYRSRLQSIYAGLGDPGLMAGKQPVVKQYITTFPTMPADATLTPERVGTVMRRIETLAGG